jgi:hypothetical protein
MRKAAAWGVRDLEALKAEHRALDEKVRALGRRAYLTPTEEQELSRLKKLKLAKKDLITDMQRASS